MSDLHVRIEAQGGNLGKALADLHRRDPDFAWPGLPWWHKPPDNARSVVARTLSRYGCSGRLSLVTYAAREPLPPPRWTGFTARRTR